MLFERERGTTVVSLDFFDVCTMDYDNINVSLLEDEVFPENKEK